MADGRGLDSLGLREVAREAGLAATSLYNHFPDMEALGLALIDRACFHLRSSMAEGRRSMIEVGAARARATSSSSRSAGPPSVRATRPCRT